jgi:ABC-type cobalt transport system substrate-binding protein
MVAVAPLAMVVAAIIVVDDVVVVVVVVVAAGKQKAQWGGLEGKHKKKIGKVPN